MSETITQAVKDKYGSVATIGLSSDHEGVKAVAEAFGYTAEELGSIPAEANMGCPVATRRLSPHSRRGEVVVDLGCGGGWTCSRGQGRADRQGDRHRHDPEMMSVPERREGCGREALLTSSSIWPGSTGCRWRTPRRIA